jgi:quercetin dioxygenase-like cupin family protein
VEPVSGAVPDPEATASAVFAGEGLTPHAWSNHPGTVYAPHQHPYRKVLVCVAGSITFHLPEGDRVLGPGDRLDVPVGTVHGATVGATGVTCWESGRR